MAKTLQIAMGQMLVEGAQRDDNLRRAVQMIHQAATRGCHILVLPECLDLGWTHPSARLLAAPIPGQSSQILCAAAAEAQIYVAAGLTERDGSLVYNAAILISPRGEILLKHRKINLLSIEQPFYATGQRLAVAQTPLAAIGLNICADNFPDSLCLGHAMARMGADILLSPSAWAVPDDYDQEAEPYGELWIKAYTQLAPMYEMPIVGVSNVGRIAGGPWLGRKCIGCSLAVGAAGQILAQAPYGEDVETLAMVEVEVFPRPCTGTDIAEMLRRKGYPTPD